jgi:hypothetical protein
MLNVIILRNVASVKKTLAYFVPPLVTTTKKNFITLPSGRRHHLAEEPDRQQLVRGDAEREDGLLPGVVRDRGGAAAAEINFAFASFFSTIDHRVTRPSFVSAVAPKFCVQSRKETDVLVDRVCATP